MPSLLLFLRHRFAQSGSRQLAELLPISTDRASDSPNDLGRYMKGDPKGLLRGRCAGEHSERLPNSVLYRTVTRAREAFEADGILENASK